MSAERVRASPNLESLKEAGATIVRYKFYGDIISEYGESLGRGFYRLCICLMIIIFLFRLCSLIENVNVNSNFGSYVQAVVDTEGDFCGTRFADG